MTNSIIQQKSSDLIYSLSIEQVNEVQSTFIDLELINLTSKQPKIEINRYLRNKKRNSKGKVKKVYIMMLSGDNLLEGIESHSKDIISHKQKR